MPLELLDKCVIAFSASQQHCLPAQAHFINNRTMEVFRPLDGLAAAIANSSPPLEQWRKFVYCESLTGRVFGEVDHFKV